MCMIAVNENLVQQAINYEIISDTNSQETLQKMFEDYLQEKINSHLRKQVLNYQGSCCWEGNLADMRASKWNDI